jgi:hypothetical protein
VDVKPTGNPVEGRSGTAKSLAYAPARGTLYVLHSFGPDHLRLMSVDKHGKLTTRPERYTVNTHDKPNRVPTMVALSPDEKSVFVGTTFDEPIVSTGLYPDGSPILWVQRAGGALHSWSLVLEYEGTVRDIRSWGQFEDLPQMPIRADIHRVTKWSKLDTTW